MLFTNKTTLAKFLIECARNKPEHSAELNALILDIANVCKSVDKTVAFGHLTDVVGVNPCAVGGEVNVQGEVQKSLDVLSNALFLHGNDWTGTLACQY